MVAVMEVSEKDIEALREAIDGCGGSSYTQAIAILDRLSPAPEVDEATVWAGKILTLLGISSGRIFSASRDVLREVLAAKDAERGHLVEGVATLEAQLEQQKYELATLRAENRPPEGYSVLRIAARDCLINVNGLGRMEGGWLLLEGVNLSVAPKAAERNTAEPGISLSDAERGTPKIELNFGPGPWPGDPDHRETMPAGAVGVTRAAATSAQIYADFHCEDGSFNVIVAERLAAEFDRVRTEAEARGRREALGTLRVPDAPNLFSAFRTTLSGDGEYKMIFRFPSMEAMHAADDEWHTIRRAIQRMMTGGK